jgi:3-oxoacyl-[acyl-carrier protein] reductase
MELGIEGKVAIVTGSGRGLGSMMAQMLATEGAKLVVTDVDAESARQTAETIQKNGGSAIAVPGDVTSSNDVRTVVDRTIEAFGRVDILVNNAGFPRDALIVNMSEEDWEAVVGVCLKGSFLFTKAVVPLMAAQNWGRIINIASRAHYGNPGQANYSAAKAGLIGLTGSQAREQGRFNITVNCVAPGFVETPLVRSLPNFEKIKAKTIANTPIPRLGREEDIANAVIFLASERASWITGEVLHVTGGRYSN